MRKGYKIIQDFYNPRLKTWLPILPSSFALAAAKKAKNTKKNFIIILTVIKADFKNQMRKIDHKTFLLYW